MKLIYIYRKIKYSVKVLLHIFGRGEINKHCPCCGYHGKFDTMGQPPRYGARCPKCRSLERHRLLVLANQEKNFFSGKDILHFAPEKILSQIIQNSAERYLTCDLTLGRADCVLNIEHIEQPDQSWDVVLCSHVLEHVDDKLALSELHRILKPGGLLLLMVPIINGWDITYENPMIQSTHDRQQHFGRYDHVRYYGNDFRNRIKKAGFDINEYTADGPRSVKYGLMRGDKVFVCSKKSEKIKRQG
jgi:SAM-dependent methyltransferase